MDGFYAAHHSHVSRVIGAIMIVVYIKRTEDRKNA